MREIQDQDAKSRKFYDDEVMVFFLPKFFAELEKGSTKFFLKKNSSAAWSQKFKAKIFIFLYYSDFLNLIS